VNPDFLGIGIGRLDPAVGIDGELAGYKRALGTVRTGIEEEVVIGPVAEQFPAGADQVIGMADIGRDDGPLGLRVAIMLEFRALRGGVAGGEEEGDAERC
jgi:hypothetical protein